MSLLSDFNAYTNGTQVEVRIILQNLNTYKLECSYHHRKHILEDLQPYICTYQNCALSDHFFNSKDEWYEHESQHHRIMWSCNTERHQDCDNLWNFINHMQKDHGATFNESTFLKAQAMFQKPSCRIDGTCNLCLRECKNLKYHVSRHLQQMAFFALPRVNEIAGSSKAGHCTESSKYSAMEIFHKQIDDNEHSSSRISSGAYNDEEEQELDSYYFEPQDKWGTKSMEVSTPFLPDLKRVWGNPESQIWDDVTSKFSDAREGRSAEPPLMPNNKKWAEQVETPPLPSCCIPFSRDPDFVERGTVLDRINHQRAVPGSWTALIGPGGVG